MDSGAGPGGLPFDPVAVRVGLPFEPQRVLAQRPHDEAGRQHGAEEHQGHHDRIHHLVQQQPELEPKPIERLECGRIEQRRRKEKDRNSAGPAPRMAVVPPVEQRHHRERSGHHDPKRPV